MVRTLSPSTAPAPSLPEGTAVVAAEASADRTITSLCDRLDRIHLIALDRSIHPSVRLEKIRELAEGFARVPGEKA